MVDQPTSSIKKVSSPEDVPGLDLVPAFANRFNVTLNQVTTRLTFGEFVAGDPLVDSNYHTAIVLPTSDALQLATLILQLHAQNIFLNTPASQPAPAEVQKDGKR